MKTTKVKNSLAFLLVVFSVLGSAVIALDPAKLHSSWQSKDSDGVTLSLPFVDPSVSETGSVTQWLDSSGDEIKIVGSVNTYIRGSVYGKEATALTKVKIYGCTTVSSTVTSCDGTGTLIVRMLDPLTKSMKTTRTPALDCTVSVSKILMSSTVTCEEVFSSTTPIQRYLFSSV